jgi:regulator of replication initiation timing
MINPKTILGFAIYLDLVEIYHNLDKKIEKLNTIRKLLEMDPENIRSRLRLAEEMSKEGMIKEAVELKLNVSQVYKKYHQGFSIYLHCFLSIVSMLWTIFLI